MIDIERLSKDKSALIDRELSRVLDGKVPNLHEAISYHMDTGGKRLRPLLAILTYEALSGGGKKVLPFAAACELLHNWFLVHDDIEDGDTTRRDKPALWVKYGLAHGINAGDYMAQKVFELIINSKDYGVDDRTIMKLVEAMVVTSCKTAEGQAMDINMRSGSPGEADYMKMVMGKTGHYFTVPMVGAAILAGREELVPKLVKFGECIGPAFQITDDLLDLTEGKGRGEIGRDIKEGKKTLMVIHCLGKCGKEKKSVLEILNKPPEKTTKKDVDFVIGLLEKHGSIDYAKQRAEKLAGEAAVCAKSIPELREVLEFFAGYMVKRKK